MNSFQELQLYLLGPQLQHLGPKIFYFTLSFERKLKTILELKTPSLYVFLFLDIWIYSISFSYGRKINQALDYDNKNK